MNRYKTEKKPEGDRKNTQNDSVGFASFAYVWLSEDEKMFRFYGDNKRDFVIEQWGNGKKRKQRE